MVLYLCSWTTALPRPPTSTTRRRSSRSRHVTGSPCWSPPSLLLYNRKRSTNISCRAEGGAAAKEEEDDSEENSDGTRTSLSPYQVLGVDPLCSFPQLKSAFRRKVKEFHPDVSKESETMIRLVIQAYKLVSKNHANMTERDTLDPFEEPECEACDLFVDETNCIGKGCPYSCVKKAPHAFSFNSETGTAHAISQGLAEDYLVQQAVGQCPRRCIHYVTPAQRMVLEEILNSILDAPYDPAENAYLDSLIVKAYTENSRYRNPKGPPKESTEFVDWY